MEKKEGMGYGRWWSRRCSLRGFSRIRSEQSSSTSQNSLGWIRKALENPKGKEHGKSKTWPWIQFIPNFLDVEGKSQGMRRGTCRFFGMEVLGFVGYRRLGWSISTCGGGGCAGIGNSQGRNLRRCPASQTVFLRDLSSLTWKTSKDGDRATPLGIPGASRIPKNSHFAFQRELTLPVLELPKLLLDGLEQSGIMGIVGIAHGSESGMDDP